MNEQDRNLMVRARNLLSQVEVNSGPKYFASCWAVCEELTAALAQQAVPDGFALVPVEPTQEMLNAVVTTVDEFLLGQMAEKQYREDWAAMLAAAPQAEREPIGIPARSLPPDALVVPAKQASQAPAPAPEGVLTKALADAAESLQTISSLAGREFWPNTDAPTHMGQMRDVRAYALNRAKVASEALDAHRSQCAAVGDEDEREPMSREQAIAIARKVALQARDERGRPMFRHLTPENCERWNPEEWVVDAIMAAAGRQAERDPLSLAVVDAARAAMDESTESFTDRMDITIPAHLASALSLRLDEYDRAHGIGDSNVPVQPMGGA